MFIENLVEFVWNFLWKSSGKLTSCICRHPVIQSVVTVLSPVANFVIFFRHWLVKQKGSQRVKIILH